MRRDRLAVLLLLLPACQYGFDLELAPEGRDLIACHSHDVCDPQACFGFVTGKDGCGVDGWYIYDDGKLVEGDKPEEADGARYLCAGGRSRYPHCVSYGDRFACDGKVCDRGSACGVWLNQPDVIRCISQGVDGQECEVDSCTVQGTFCVEFLETDPASGEAFHRTACVPEIRIGPP